jgi:hypothetical protein
VPQLRLLAKKTPLEQEMFEETIDEGLLMFE